MAVSHVVLFGFDPKTPAEDVKRICDGMLALKDQCLHPTSQKPYIQSRVGGIDNSIEGLQHGMTHAFIVEFENKEDRDYYAKEDPSHKAFVKELLKVTSNVLVVDFTPGVF